MYREQGGLSVKVIPGGVLLDHSQKDDENKQLLLTALMMELFLCLVEVTIEWKEWEIGRWVGGFASRALGKDQVWKAEITKK